MELAGLAGVMASALGLALTIYGVFYNGRVTRALIESIRQDIRAVHEVMRALQETTRTIHEDGQRRHEELLTYLREMDRRHTELMAAIAQGRA